MTLNPYTWDTPASGDKIVPGTASYSTPPTESEINAATDINQVIAVYRKEKSDHAFSYDDPAYYASGDKIEAADFNALEVIRQTIQTEHAGTTSKSPHYPASTDKIVPAHVIELQAIGMVLEEGNEIDDVPYNHYEGTAGSFTGEWLEVNGIRWYQTSQVDWTTMLTTTKYGFNRLVSEDDPAVTQVGRVWDIDSSPDYYQHCWGASRYKQVGGGYPGDIAQLDAVTNAYIDITTFWMDGGQYNQKMAVMMGFNALQNENRLVAHDSGSDNGIRADRIYMETGKLSTFTVGDIVRIFETTGINPGTRGEQYIVIDKVTADGTDPNYPNYLLMDHVLSGTYKTAKSAYAWKVEGWDDYKINAVIQATVDTNNYDGYIRVYLDPAAITIAIKNDWNLDLFFVPILLDEQPKDETDKRYFHCGIYLSSIQFEYTELPPP